MSNVFSLDSMREELENQYKPVRIALSDGDEVVLQNILRMPEKARTKVLDKLDEMSAAEEKEDAEGVSQAQAMNTMSRMTFEVLALVAADGKGAKLVKELQDDILLAMELVRRWQESTQPGEAQDSPA